MISIRAPQSASWPAISGTVRPGATGDGTAPAARIAWQASDVGQRVGDVDADHVARPDAAPGQPGRGALQQSRPGPGRQPGTGMSPGPPSSARSAARAAAVPSSRWVTDSLADRCLCRRHGIGEPPARVHRQFRRLRGTAVPLSSVRRVGQDLVLAIDPTLFTSARPRIVRNM